MLGRSNKETRSCIQWVKCHCPSGVRIRLIDSDNPRTYRRVTPGPRDLSGASLVLAGLAWCWITPLGYPLLMRACLMCLVSWSLAVTVEQTAAALLWSVLTTASLWAECGGTRSLGTGPCGWPSCIQLLRWSHPGHVEVRHPGMGACLLTIQDYTWQSVCDSVSFASSISPHLLDVSKAGKESFDSESETT